MESWPELALQNGDREIRRVDLESRLSKMVIKEGGFGEPTLQNSYQAIRRVGLES